MQEINSQKVLEIIQDAITTWHKENEGKTTVVLSDKVKEIRELNCHREDVFEVIREIAVTNTDIWHEEDKVRSEKDDVVLAAIRNINPLNQHRNDLIEEVDEIFVDEVKKER